MIFDTDVLIWFFRGNARAAQLLQTQADRGISIISLMELYQGARAQAEIKKIRGFLQANSFRVVPVNEAISHLAATLVEEHSLKHGIHLTDALIGCYGSRARRSPGDRKRPAHSLHPSLAGEGVPPRLTANGLSERSDGRIKFVYMERAGRSIAKLQLSDAVSHDDLACAAWTTVIGKRLERHAWAKALVRGNLVVEVEDAVWQKQLFHLRFQILGRLSELLGNGIVKDVEFRIARPAGHVPPRRPPQPAQSLAASNPADEADRIEDPVQRMVYKQARKRSSA
ncbi:MAG TPA: DciA family protein [Bryobacteraceae bacterium]|nr:DciA family protein [Bryobacteraceae bacterium]